MANGTGLPRSVRGAALVVALGLFACGGAAERATRPNFVLLVADDLGWRDVGYRGGDYPTPVIDRLARTGTRLERFYVQPLCSPTRAALLTGRYPIRYGLQSCALRPWAKVGLDLEEETLADALRAAGYTTAIVGKWHLGHWGREYLPTNRGFEHQYGPYNGGVNYVTHERLGRLDWHRDDRPLEEEGYATNLIAREAVRLIRGHDFTDPLFLYVPFTAVHSPRSAPAQLVERFRHLEPEPRRVYAAMVASLDRAVGDVLEALDRAGVREDTFVLFGADNGGAPGMGDNGELRGFKGGLTEGGIRTGWIASWPGVLERGIVDAPLHVTDLFPTLLTLAGAQYDAERLDGQPVFDLVARRTEPTPRELLLYSGPRGGALLEGSLKLVVENRKGEADPKVALYDVVADPTESRDLAADEPETVARMRARLDAFAAEAVPPFQLAATRPEGFEPPRVWGEVP